MPGGEVTWTVFRDVGAVKECKINFSYPAV